ncbi:MAG: tyrosine-type recombinase/integrase [Aeromonas veronii]
MITAKSLLAQFRTVAPIVQAVAAGNTKEPIREHDQATVRDHIRRNCAPWLAVFHDLSVITGWRTADVCNLTFDCIDWQTGKVSITVAKQSKAAQARALGKYLEQVRTARKQSALATGDSVAYMQWDSATRDAVAASMTAQEQQEAAQAVAAAPRKVDTKQLPQGLIKRLAAMQERNQWDNCVFSRRLTESNRCRSLDGAITRQTVWSHMKRVFAALAGTVANVAKLSAYSLRKTFAINMLARSGNVAVVMSLFGHSSVQMTMKYLGLASEAEELQAAMGADYA